MKFLCSILAIALCLPAAATAAESGLDPEFGTGGRVVTDFGNSAAGIQAAAFAPDGSIVAAGPNCSLPPVSGRTCDLALVRYSPQGQELQRSGNGFAQLPDFVPSDVAVDAAGRVVVVGRYYSQGWSPAVARFLPDGSIDPAVSSAELPDSFAAKVIEAVAVDGSDRILLAGPSTPAGGQVARLQASGNPDPEFGGGDGVATVPSADPSAPQVLADMVLSPQGTVYLGGTLEVGDPEAGPSGALLLSALDGTGEPVPNFSATAPLTQRARHITGLALDSQGHLLASLDSGGGSRLRVARVLADGSLDGSFGSGGIAGLLTCNGCAGEAAAVAVDGQDRPLTISSGFELARYTASGQPDQSFSADGSVTTGFGKGSRASSGVVLSTPSDQPIVLGARRLGIRPVPSTPVQFAAARYGAPSCFDVAGTIVGTPGPDRLVGTPGRDVVLAGAGDDEVLGLGGRDLVCAGPGRDQLMGGPGRDRLYGQAGSDKLFGGDGVDFLRGGNGADLLRGGRGKDWLN